MYSTVDGDIVKRMDAAPVAVATVRVAVAAPVVLATEDVDAMDVLLATLKC